MSRIRTIKPEFPQSETMGKLSRDARLLFVLLWTIVDDKGRARAASRMLASLLFPYDDDAPKLIDRWLDELEREGCIRRYEVGGSKFLDLPNWLKHQKIDRPSDSKLPGFDEYSPLSREDSRGFDADLVPSTKDQDSEANASLVVGDDEKVRLMVEIYHQYGSPKFPKVYKITAARRSAALRRWKDCGGEVGWRELMMRAAASQHLTGNNNRGWTADFDFFLQEKSFTRLREGFYDARKPSGPGYSRPLSGADVALAVRNELLDPGSGRGGGRPAVARTLDAERDGTGLYRFAG